MTQEERKQAQAGASPEASAEETAPPADATEPENQETEEEREVVEDLSGEEAVAEGEVAEDLGTMAVKGPAFDQDEGQIQTDKERNRRKERVGLVVSDVADKTVTVTVETLIRHKRYKKRLRRTKKFMVHDEANAAHIGDTVRIIETRPLSKRKRWRLANVISRAE